MIHYKKIAHFLLIASAISASSNSNAQKISLGADAGYGLTIPTTKSFRFGTSPAERVDVGCLLGKGFSLGMNADMMLFSRAGVNIGVHYLIGDSITGSKSTRDNFNETIKSITLEANMLRLTPSIILMAFNKEEKTNIYLKLGIIIGLASKLNDIEVYQYSYLGTPYSHSYRFSSTLVYEWSGGTSTGFTSTIGLCTKAGKSGNFNLELCFASHSWAPKKKVATSYTSGTSNLLATLSESEIETDFVDSESEITSNNRNEPSKELKVHLPMSAVYLSVGYQFHFGKKKKAANKSASETK